jgi:uncharacterized protein involved in exopolysaccharide biosynthesis
MEQQLQFQQIKSILWRRKWWLAVPFIIVVSVVTIIAVVLPSIYVSSSTILIQDPQIPDEVVKTGVTSYADQRIQSITQEIMSRSKILALVAKYDLLPKKREKLSAEEVVDAIRDRIKVNTIDAEVKKDTQVKPILLTIAFELSTEDEDPKKAQAVTAEIASYFLERNLEAREKHVRTTAKFLGGQVDQAKEHLDDLEAKLAAYRKDHLEELPEFSNLNMQKLEKLNSDISNINMQVRSLEEQRTTIKGNMGALDPLGSSTGRVISTDERLQQAQMELAALISRYSEKHPLVQAKKQEIAVLEKDSGGAGANVASTSAAADNVQELETKLATLKGQYTEKHPLVVAATQELAKAKQELRNAQSQRGSSESRTAGAPTNPAYIALRSDLEKVSVTISALNAEKQRIEQQMKDVYDKLHGMPEVSKVYNELSTDYMNAKAHYTDLQQKYMASQVAQGMEEQQLGENFQIVEPAFLPEKSSKPNRIVIILLGVILGAGFSVGLAGLREISDRNIHDLRSVEELTNLPVLSVIPRMLTKEEVRAAGRKKAYVVVCVVAGILITVAAFHFFVMDLYVFYAKLGRFVDKRWPI